MNLRQKIEQHLSAEAIFLIESVSTISSESGNATYLVGGAVRDVLLGRESYDLDFVTEGSGIELAEVLAQNHGGELVAHQQFGTAVWTPPKQLFDHTIDCITARRETYAHPAALPDVIVSNMKDDLFRRDFSINAMAVRLDGHHFGELLDLYGGASDLENQQIRVLHTKSFEDDPTRIFRAIRYMGRLNFKLEAHTESWLINQRDNIQLLSADRIRHELEKILVEADPYPILTLLEHYRCLEFIPHVVWGDLGEQNFNRLSHNLNDELGKVTLAESDIVRLRFLTWLFSSPPSAKTAFETAKALNFPAEWQNDIVRVLRFAQPSEDFETELPPSAVEKLFRGMSATQLTVLKSVQWLPPQFDNLIDRYFFEWQYIKPISDGNTLIKMGLQPGPRFKIILDALLAATLDGKIQSAEDEAALIESLSNGQK
ncbi:MAG: CCA tRNA nucleotidyltransferase [Chloroflexota bacterium]